LDPADGLPTTDAGTLPVFTHVDQGSDYATHSISNHILLNNFGHMLIYVGTRTWKARPIRGISCKGWLPGLLVTRCPLPIQKGCFFRICSM
jgi:hypothetical protein